MNSLKGNKRLRLVIKKGMQIDLERNYAEKRSFEDVITVGLNLRYFKNIKTSEIKNQLCFVFADLKVLLISFASQMI